jgi:hypothetical protein
MRINPGQKVGSVNYSGMNSAQVKYWLDNGNLTDTARTTLSARLAGLVADEKAKAAAPVAATAAPGISSAASSMATGDWVKGQNANIDRQSEQNLAQGMSNMIGSGLAGTTAVGGMTAGVGEWAARAKGDVAGEAQRMDLATNEAALNRSFQAGQSALDREQETAMGQLSASTSLQKASMSNQTPSEPGLDAFGRPMPGSVQARQLAALEAARKASEAAKATGPAAVQTAPQPIQFNFG